MPFVDGKKEAPTSRGQQPPQGKKSNVFPFPIEEAFATRKLRLLEKEPAGVSEAELEEAFRLRKLWDNEKARLVEKYEPLVQMQLVWFMRNMRNIPEEQQEEALQEGRVGLVNAIERFDPDKETKFETFATICIRGAIRHWARDKKIFHQLNRSDTALSKQVYAADELLRKELRREPTDFEIATFIADLGPKDKPISKKKFDALLSRIKDIGTKAHEFSLDAMINEEGQEGVFTLLDSRKAPEAGEPQKRLSEMVISDDLANLLNLLDEEERCVIELLFLRELSQAKVASVLACSQMNVSRIRASALVKMRRHAAEQRLSPED